MLELLLVPGCRVDRLRREDGLLIVEARPRRERACCPDCHCRSQRVHGYHRRRPADLPIGGRQTRLDLRLCRYVCLNPGCKRQTFTEQLPALVAPRARRTSRLSRVHREIGLALGGAPGGRLASRIGVQISGATLLRCVRAAPVHRERPPTIIGVDDWAVRKRQRYGTIIVDLERRRAIDLLPDRTSATLATWLREHPNVEIVARDRSSEYTRAITATAGSATQVADRWHLLYNTRQMVERWAAGAHARLRKLPSIPDVASRGRTKAFLRTRAAAVSAADSRERWRARYNEVRHRFIAGEKLLAISRAMGLARGTVRKFAYAESFPDRAVQAPGASIIDPYLPHLEARLAEGCENAAQLWRECRDRGFPGGAQQIRRWLQERRTQVHKHTAYRWRDMALPGATPPAAPALPSPKQLAWLIVKSPGARDAEEAAAITRIEQDRDATTVIRLVGKIGDLIRGSGITSKKPVDDPVAIFDAWLPEARTCGVPALETFATGLEQDGAAVRAALTIPWSNAQAEGQITKLKLLKRSMYGRAKLDLLRQRLLLAA